MEQPNMTYINELSAGDEAFKVKIIAIIKEEFPIEKQTYLKNRDEGDFKATAESVHKLKHKISILGLVKSYEVAADYEHNLLEKSTAGKDDFESILQNMTEFLETL